MAHRFTTQLDVPLRVLFDPEPRIAQASKAVLIKGMFLAQHAAAIGEGWPEVERKLLSPPRDGRYLTYADYPLQDYLRVVFTGAVRAYPALSLAEGCRRAARLHMQAFAASTVGRVMLEMITEPRRALLDLPDMFARGSRGIVVEAAPRGGGVRLEMQHIGGLQDCSAIGTLEGCVLRYGATPSIDVHIRTSEHAVYDVTWT